MSAHWAQKMNTYFVRVDFDHDGVLTRGDFEAMAKRFTEHGKFDAKKGADLKATLTAVWDKYLAAVGGGDKIEKSAFVESMKKVIADPTSKKVIEGQFPLFFHAVDANNDGQISEAEFVEFFTVLGLDAKLSGPAFKAIDTNNDKEISLEEFTAAGSEFFFAQEAKPTDVFWGNLV